MSLPRFFASRIDVQSAELAQRIQALANELRSLEEKARELKVEFFSFVESHKTFVNLLDKCPEIEKMVPHFKDYLKGSSIGALVVPAKQILCKVSELRGEEREGCCSEPTESAAETVAESVAA